MPSTLSALVVIVAITVATVQREMVGGMPGGFTEQNAADPEYMERAWKAAKGINDDASNAGPYHMMPIKVVKAKSQVVAGVKHNFEVLYGESKCKKGDYSASELNSTICELKSGGNRALYEVELWEKPWENFEQFNVKKIRNVGAEEII